ncbi:MAG: hypothetical protein WC326_06885 [Candidatus Delongbacteria bacterium]
MKATPFLLILLTILTHSAEARRSLVVAAGDSLCLDGLELWAGAAPALVCRGSLVLENARLRARRGSQEPLVRVEAGGRLWLKNCRLEDARSAGRADERALIELSGGELTLQFSTLWTRTARSFLSLESGAQARLNSCLFSAATPGDVTWFQLAPRSQLEAAWCLSDACGADSTYKLPQLGGLPQLRGLRAIPAARLVDPAHGDLRLRWDSPCLDSGAPGAPLDFDLTQADVGWTPRYPVQQLSGPQNRRRLARGWYEGQGEVDFRSPRLRVDDGVVLRLAPEARLFLGSRVAHGSLRLGRPGGARLALVGSQQPELGAARDCWIGPAAARRAIPLQAHGLLIHEGFAEGVGFRHLSLSLQADSTRLSPALQGPLCLLECRARLADYEFLSRAGDKMPARMGALLVQGGELALRNCRFDGSQTRSFAPVILAGVRALQPGLDSCDWRATTGGAGLGLLTLDSQVRLTRSRLSDFPTQILALASDLHLESDAGNLLRQDGLCSRGLIQLQDSRLALCEGGNQFVQFPYAPYVQSRGLRPSGQVDWSGNYWSHCVGPGLGCRPVGQVPRWVDPAMHCLSDGWAWPAGDLRPMPGPLAELETFQDWLPLTVVESGPADGQSEDRTRFAADVRQLVLELEDPDPARRETAPSRLFRRLGEGPRQEP